MTLRRPLRTFVATALAACLGACGLQQGIGQGSDAGQSSPTAAPAINQATIEGARFSWGSVRGRVVVLDFWASWCGPCRAEQPDINSLHRTFGARGVVFLGVDMRDDNAAALAYNHDYAVSYPSVADADDQISGAYNVTAPPTIILIDKQGKIVQRYLGTIAGLGDDLNRVLGQNSTS